LKILAFGAGGLNPQSKRLKRLLEKGETLIGISVNAAGSELYW
jgi:hypothetical protein